MLFFSSFQLETRHIIPRWNVLNISTGCSAIFLFVFSSFILLRLGIVVVHFLWFLELDKIFRCRRNRWKMYTKLHKVSQITTTTTTKKILFEELHVCMYVSVWHLSVSVWNCEWRSRFSNQKFKMNMENIIDFQTCMANRSAFCTNSLNIPIKCWLFDLNSIFKYKRPLLHACFYQNDILGRTFFDRIIHFCISLYAIFSILGLTGSRFYFSVGFILFRPTRSIFLVSFVIQIELSSYFIQKEKCVYDWKIKKKNRHQWHRHQNA